MMIKKKDHVVPVIFVFVLLVWLSTRVFLLGSAQKSSTTNNNRSIEVNVGVILDLETTFGKMGLRCINMAISDFYASNPHYNTRLILHTKGSKSDVVGAAAAEIVGLPLPTLSLSLKVYTEAVNSSNPRNSI
ncbi:hypothetical protein L484_007167 [Morus notabilis]|uniref:Uncharacterized protein n=1 Tax=Morus notabilis TaxID=981085 RepID=W9RZE7_9ROSA|nr:hypothetical protein L484_007167 [Morus notabilis]